MMIKTIILAVIGALGAAAWDWWQKKQGLRAQIENVGLQQKQHEDLESKAAEEAIIRAQLDAIKELPKGDHRDFEQ